MGKWICRKAKFFLKHKSENEQFIPKLSSVQGRQILNLKQLFYKQFFVVLLTLNEIFQLIYFKAGMFFSLFLSSPIHFTPADKRRWKSANLHESNFQKFCCHMIFLTFVGNFLAEIYILFTLWWLCPWGWIVDNLLFCWIAESFLQVN